MQPLLLTDKTQLPTDEIIFTHIGKTKALWISFFEYLHTTYADISTEWKYYNDGKSWLCKATRKSKTVFWLSIIPGSFRTTFYFTDKAELPIAQSKLSDELKEQFKNGKYFGKIRAATVTFKRKQDIEDAKILIALKLSSK